MEAFLRAMREVSLSLSLSPHLSPFRPSSVVSSSIDLSLTTRFPTPTQIERHPQVLHLPAPHIWQLTPSLAVTDADLASPYTPASAVQNALEKAQGPAQSLVVTLELHVRHDLEDAEVLRLTRWAWERCVHALHFGTRGGEGGEGEAEVTVGIVKG